MLGAHVSISDGLLNAAKLLHKNKGNILQIFLSSPRTRKMTIKNKSDKDIKEFVDYIKKNNITLVIHSSYLLNIAKDWDKRSWSINNLITELEYADKMGAIGVVIHLGKRLELSKEIAFNNMYTSLIYVAQQTRKLKVKILIETSSGQGSEMCFEINKLAELYCSLNSSKYNNRFGICIDTCHIFAAGYDIKTKENINKYMKEFDKLIGIKHIKLIHLNDSKKDLGSKVDRHEELGKGFIEWKGIKYFYQFAKMMNIPVIMETPQKSFIKEISKLLKY